MTREEYLALYEKFLQGNCSLEEIGLLESHKDYIRLESGEWEHAPEGREDLQTRLLQQIHSSIDEHEAEHGQAHATRQTFPLAGRLRQIAALLIAVSAAGFWFGILLKQRQSRLLVSKIPAIHNLHAAARIQPGGNKAWLKLADGSQIILDDAKTGKLLSHNGLQISKSREGLLVYRFSNAQTLQSRTGSVSTGNAVQLNTISTPRGGQYELVLSDGTKVWLNAASSLRFPSVFAGDLREVELSGEAYFEVAKDRKKPFQVTVGDAHVEVLGTHFDINAYHDRGGIKTTLLEGSVRMVSGSSHALLEPGQQAEVSADGKAISVSKADIARDMGWKNGFFVFHEESLGNIMKQVSRWYDVDIEVRDEVAGLEFGGRISRAIPITDLMRYMELTRSFHYKVSGRRITIMR